MGEKALVLGGGGSRGSYQIGVWKALKELGFDFSVVTGTSVGALNGAMIAQGEYDLAIELWQQIKTSDILDIQIDGSVENPRDLAQTMGAFLKEIFTHGGTDARPLEELLRRFVDEEKIKSSPVRFGFVTVELPRLVSKIITTENIPDGQMVDYLMASAACFPAMKARLIDDKTYIDGAYYDNLPIEIAAGMGADDIIAVDLEAVGLIRKVNEPALRVRYLRSRWDLGMTLLFETDTAMRNITLGYLDTYKLFGRYEGCLYTFYTGETEKLCQTVAKKADVFLAKSDLYVRPGHLYPAQIRVAGKLKKHYDQPEIAFSDEQMILAGAEMAGKILGLPPTEVYTARDFEQRLLALFAPADEAVSPVWSSGARKEIKKILQGLDSTAVTAFCLKGINGLFAGTVSPAAVRALCSAVTEEFMAAVYLHCLQQAGAPDKPKDGEEEICSTKS